MPATSCARTALSSGYGVGLSRMNYLLTGLRRIASGFVMRWRALPVCALIGTGRENLLYAFVARPWRFGVVCGHDELLLARGRAAKSDKPADLDDRGRRHGVHRLGPETERGERRR